VFDRAVVLSLAKFARRSDPGCGALAHLALGGDSIGGDDIPADESALGILIVVERLFMA
jgi:hypothetical protein